LRSETQTTKITDGPIVWVPDAEEKEFDLAPVFRQQDGEQKEQRLQWRDKT